MAVQKYRSKISGPLLDRGDIHLSVPPVAHDDLAARPPAESGRIVPARVGAARDRQLHRFRQVPGVYANAQLGPRELGREVMVDAATESVQGGGLGDIEQSFRGRGRAGPR
jgi:magnesium chelatase family protein